MAKLSEIGTAFQTYETAKAEHERTIRDHAAGRIGWGGVLEARDAMTAAYADVVATSADYTADPEAEA